MSRLQELKRESTAKAGFISPMLLLRKSTLPVGDDLGLRTEVRRVPGRGV